MTSTWQRDMILDLVAFWWLEEGQVAASALKRRICEMDGVVTTQAEEVLVGSFGFRGVHVGPLRGNVFFGKSTIDLALPLVAGVFHALDLLRRRAAV